MSLDYSVEVMADSLSPDGVRLTTLKVTHPRFILAEVNTHRMLSRNSASSRAIPTEKQIDRVLDQPFVPETFNQRVKGMGVGEALDDSKQAIARREWIEASLDAVRHATVLNEVGIDKSRANRLLEPFMWHTAIITATEWSNFYALRDNTGAQPEFQIIAQMMREAMWENEPTPLDYGEWHLPGISDDELAMLCRTRREDSCDPEQLDSEIDEYKRVSARRLARVSFDKVSEDEEWSTSVERAGVLMTNGHVSPLEHVARPLHQDDFFNEDLMDKITLSARAHCELIRGGTVPMGALWAGNFRGWLQFRKELPNEDNFARHLAQESIVPSEVTT
jgi:thymidylate synthase ThyX